MKINTNKSIFSLIKNSPLYGRTLIILLFIALIIKCFIIYSSYKNLNPWGNVISNLSGDIIVIFFAQLLILLNYWIKKPAFRLINNFIVLVILLIFLIDIFAIYFFQSRVPIVDVFALGSGGSSGFSNEVILRILLILFLGIIIFLCVQKFDKFKRNKKIKLIIFSICMIFYALFYIVISIFKVDIDTLDNIFTLNFSKTNEENLKNLEDEEDKEITYDDYILQVKGGGKNLNIILVFAESLSAIDSANVGGNDKMPKFDEIQKNGMIFKNFITNGITSDTAHIATLFGVVPLINVGPNDSTYSGYKLLMQPLPKYLNTQGYNTIFISTARLSFLNQRDFLSTAGFKKIIGEEEFIDNKKYTFSAAPDEDLYDRVLREVESQTGKYFIGLQTISFHKPYNTPYGKTEELALKYSDEELYNFYQKLQDLGFFENGILVILGDHRKMSSAEEGESDIFGPNRYTRSVATIVGSGIQPGLEKSGIIQHTDFYNSLKRLVGSGYVEVDSLYNDVFSRKVGRQRGITSARYLNSKNKYTVSILGESGFTFNNISLFSDRGEIYEYLLSYMNFELGNDTTPSNTSGTILIGHQGARNDATENSFQSFVTAKKQGANGVEFDVSYTKDHKNIVAHGEYFYASDCRELKIKDYSYDWIKENCTLKNGEKFRTLEEMLELIDGLFNYYFVEIKVYDDEVGAQQTLDAIQTVKNLNMQDRVIFISYSDVAREILNADPDIIYGRDTFDINDLDFVGENNSKYFLAPYNMLTPDVVWKARSLGKEVATYTVNKTGDFQTIKDLGINIIMTDNINLMKEYETES